MVKYVWIYLRLYHKYWILFDDYLMIIRTLFHGYSILIRTLFETYLMIIPSLFEHYSILIRNLFEDYSLLFDPYWRIIRHYLKLI